MKKLLPTLILLFTVTLSAQIVTIPDPIFKDKLLNHLPVIDTNGDGEIQVSEAEALEFFDITESDVNDATGIEAFVNITNMTFKGGDFSDLDITNLENLEFLDLSQNNNLSNLTMTHNATLLVLSLTNTAVSQIDISDNINLQILSLTNTNIDVLDISQNINLIELYIGYTSINAIDVSNHILLENLYIYGTPISNIDVSQNINLKEFYAYECNFSAIDVSQNIALENLDIASNNISNLDVTNNVNLRGLVISFNNFTNIDISQNTSLQGLLTGGNNLSSLDVSNNVDLRTLTFHNNPIQTIDLSNNSNLRSLGYVNTGLTELDFSNNPEMRTLNGGDNFYLNYINLKNGNNNLIDYFNNSNSPNLHFICVDDVTYAATNFTNKDPLTTFIDDCTIANNDINHIEGTITYDDEGNGCDGGDLGVQNLIVNTTDGTHNFATSSGSSGAYNLNVAENTYTTTVLGLSPYFTLFPLEEVDTFVGFGQTEIADFCIQPAITANDLTVSLGPIIPARPGFEATYELTYENVGTTQLNGSVVLEFDDSRISFSNSIPVPSSQTANTITWDFANFNPFTNSSIELTFDVAPPPTNESGDVLQFTATVNPVAGDETPEDNVFELNQVVVNSFDPNNKIVVQGHQVLIEDADKYLNYVVNFQNLGTASAVNVRVIDVLDELLDWTTLRILESSHSMETTVINGQIEFIFDNINLPPESSDPEGSQGYVLFKVKPVSEIILGDTVENFASIYFDFNPAIITNTVSTTYVEELSVTDFREVKMVLFPNPVEDSFQIHSEILIQNIEIFSILGQKVKAIQSLNKTNASINVSELPVGYYFIKVLTEEGFRVFKIIKE